MWLQRAPLTKCLSLSEGPWQWALLFFQPESGLCWSDRRIHFLPEKVASAEVSAGRSLPSSLPMYPGFLLTEGLGRPLPETALLSLSCECFICRTQPCKLRTDQVTEPLCSLPGLLGGVTFGLHIKHGPRCLFHSALDVERCSFASPPH